MAQGNDAAFEKLFNTGAAAQHTTFGGVGGDAAPAEKSLTDMGVDAEHARVLESLKDDTEKYNLAVDAVKEKYNADTDKLKDRKPPTVNWAPNPSILATMTRQEKTPADGAVPVRHSVPVRGSASRDQTRQTPCQRQPTAARPAPPTR